MANKLKLLISHVYLGNPDIYIYDIGELPGLHIKVRLGVEQRKGRCAPLGLEICMDIDTIEATSHATCNKINKAI
jgi:predicted amidohydrolase